MFIKPPKWRVWDRKTNCSMKTHVHSKTVWLSGLMRWIKAPVRKGVGSTPTAVTLHPPIHEYNNRRYYTTTPPTRKQQPQTRKQIVSTNPGTHKRNHNRAHGVVVSHPFSMREAQGSLPCVSNLRIKPRSKPHCCCATPAVDQLVGHLNVDACRNQMVPGSVPGGRIL